MNSLLRHKWLSERFCDWSQLSLFAGSQVVFGQHKSIDRSFESWPRDHRNTSQLVSSRLQLSAVLVLTLPQPTRWYTLHEPPPHRTAVR
jgi:hypothetical protein